MNHQHNHSSLYSLVHTPDMIRPKSRISTSKGRVPSPFTQLCLATAIAIATFSLLVDAFPAQYFFNSQQRTRCCGHNQQSLQFMHALSKLQEDHAYWKLPRLYVRHANQTLITGASIPLSSDQAHYLINVMRIFKKSRKNKRRYQEQSNAADDEDDTRSIDRDCIRIFNGDDGEWLAKVHEQQAIESPTNRRSKKANRSTVASLVAECIIQLQKQDYNEDERPWVLFVPLKKQQRMKYMIEKTTELGVGGLRPVASDLMEGAAISSSKSTGANHDMIYGGSSNKQDNSIRFDKLEIQCIEASEQCERLDIPTISFSAGSQDTLPDVQDILEQWCFDWEQKSEKKRILLICRERGSSDTYGGKAMVMPVLQALQCNKLVSFLVGPEGGWSSREEEMFDNVCLKYSETDIAPVQCVSLGSSVLRAETASMLAVGAWSLVNDLH